MTKGIFCVLICMLMLVGTLLPLSDASCQQKTSNSDSASQKESIFWNVRPGFIIGYFDSVTWDGDRCIIFYNGTTTSIPVTFVTPFRSHQLNYNEQIQLINPNFCLIHNHFVIGFSKIFLPKSTVSMDIISQNDQENTVTWVVDSIEGDSVWGSNMHVVIYDQFHRKYVGESISGPYEMDYLRVGDQFFITTTLDGLYKVKLIDDVTGRVLYSSPYINF